MQIQTSTYSFDVSESKMNVSANVSDEGGAALHLRGNVQEQIKRCLCQMGISCRIEKTVKEPFKITTERNARKLGNLKGG
jgi:hypothetical protein